ncbi:MAG TPA: hypothetical protein IGS52_16000 [Oscillatoriaceae cyanobacterium M33_DOE_052]|uniref:DUF697 domain-containing protein n=1 Tax=Planktothricoides sp. SpSt-374 TaxID=2282167 RepID=A0A7C3VJ35_9CYAN|nr:hypothetical protein [Oscillatoriaceae cyanobacterium M33_DOE_052]
MTSNPHLTQAETEPDIVSAALAERIADQIEFSIEDPGISVRAALNQQVLEVTLSEGNTAVSPTALISSVRDIRKTGQLNFIKTLRIYWQEKGGEQPLRAEDFPIADSQESEAAEDSALSTETAESGKTPWQTLGKLSASIAAAASDLGKTVADTAVTIGGTLGAAASDVGKAVADTAVTIGGTLGVAADRASDFFSKVTEFATNSPVLANAIDSVDLVKAQTALTKLIEQYPEETPQQIAHRLMVEKSIYSGSMGLACSILPGAAVAALAVDLGSVMALQAEMVYQIAGAYGLDLKAPERKPEVLAIFSIGMGGVHAIELGAGLLRGAPVVGSAIGASANAAITYAIGHAACRFYEQQDSQMWGEENLAAAIEESDKYLEEVLSQEAIAAEILVRLILGAHPHKSREEVAAELAFLNFTAASVAAIAAHSDSEALIDTLLQQLDEDFALPVLVNSLKIAQIHGTTPETTLVVTSLVDKFNIDLTQLPLNP